MKRIDFKYSIWERVYLNDEDDLEKIMEEIRKKKITLPHELINFIGNKREREKILSSEESLTPKNNNNFSTLEVWDNDKLRMYNGNNIDNPISFKPHGQYTISNSGGYLIEISNSGDMARVKDNFSQEITEISDWLPIVEKINEDNEVESWIDPDVEGEEGHYNIPLNQVMIYHTQKT